MPPLLKHPSAWLPIAMSLAALTLVLSFLALYGVPQRDPNADEGTAAHLFQLLLGLQLPIIVFFLYKHLLKTPKETFVILTLQGLAIIAAFAPVFLFRL